MSSPIDIASLLRQRMLMDQLNQITSQGTGAAMMGGGANLRQFDDTGGGTQTTSTGVDPDPQMQLLRKPPVPQPPQGLSYEQAQNPLLRPQMINSSPPRLDQLQNLPTTQQGMYFPSLGG